MTGYQGQYKFGDLIDGKYHVHLALLGGLGEVYLCQDLNSPLQFLALKTFQPHLLEDPQARAAFEREAAIWVSLGEHINIVPCVSTIILDSRPFMWLEWIQGDSDHGVDLRSWIQQGALPPQLALSFAYDICSGLSYASQKQPGLVHRDLKPENILITKERVARITDFGLAKLFSELTDQNVPEDTTSLNATFGAGTPRYMSPEQWRGEEPDQRTDIYAIGCILYEMFTGQPPFDAVTVPRLRKQHLEAPIPQISTSASIPPEINAILARCLAKSRDERYTDISQLQDEIDALYYGLYEAYPLTKTMTTLAEVSRPTNYNYHHVGRGAAYITQGKYQQALEELNEAIRINPEEPDAYYYRAIALREMGNYEASLADVEHGEKLDPAQTGKYTIALANILDSSGQKAQAVEVYSQALSLASKEEIFRVYYNRGRAYLDLGDTEKALADFSQAIELNPKHLDSWVARAIARLVLGQDDAANSDFEQARLLDPMDPAMYLARAQHYIRTKQPDLELREYDQAISIGIRSAQIYYNRGNLYEDLKRTEDAVGDYTEAITISPRMVKAYLRRAVVLTFLSRTREALDDLRQVLKIDPKNMTAYFYMGYVYYTLQADDEALESCRKAIELEAEISQPYAITGRILYRRGQLHDAHLYLEHAVWRGDQEAGKLSEEILNLLLRPSGEQAFELLMRADSLNNVRHILNAYPFAMKPDWVRQLEMTQQLMPNYRPGFAELIGWIKQVASENASALDFASFLQQVVAEVNQKSEQVKSIESDSINPLADPNRHPFRTFLYSMSLEDMRFAVKTYPDMINPAFVEAVLDAIANRVRPIERPIFEQQLEWLQTAIAEQKGVE